MRQATIRNSTSRRFGLCTNNGLLLHGSTVKLHTTNQKENSSLTKLRHDDYQFQTSSFTAGLKYGHSMIVLRRHLGSKRRAVTGDKDQCHPTRPRRETRICLDSIKSDKFPRSWGKRRSSNTAAKQSRPYPLRGTPTI